VRLYAETPGRRARQVAADVAVLGALWAAWRLGTWLHDLVAALAGPGRAAVDAGEELADTAGGAAEQAGSVPVVGDALRGPLDALADAGGTLADAGLAQQGAIADLALVLALAVAAVPALLLLALWLPRRVRGAREATAAAHLRSGSGALRLFALRALVHRPLRDLRRAAPDPWAAYEAGEWDALAAVELRALGLRPPPPAASRSVTRRRPPPGPGA